MTKRADLVATPQSIPAPELDHLLGKAAVKQQIRRPVGIALLRRATQQTTSWERVTSKLWADPPRARPSERQC